ncbi:Zn-ribbon domain-containing OB-fold protein [Streptomyces sp. NPDC101150]|uniref:Zn-ribbon domain-containing OB-fold protein n=1 Tax=Streptomyces sp. NPDC101150 TaxID=3366114 RepID=UPI0038289597
MSADSNAVDRGCAPVAVENHIGPNQPDAEHPGDVVAGKLYFQRCRWCRTAVFRRLLCPVCANTDMVGERSAGVGAIHHIAVVGRSTGAPRTLAIIEMGEGFRLRARIVGTPPGAVHVGNLVELAMGGEAAPRELLFRLCEA